MKKLIIFMIILLGLIACNKNDSPAEAKEEIKNNSYVRYYDCGKLNQSGSYEEISFGDSIMTGYAYNSCSTVELNYTRSYEISNDSLYYGNVFNTMYFFGIVELTDDGISIMCENDIINYILK